MIKLHNLARISEHIKKDLDKAFQSTLDESCYLRGSSVKDFETKWAQYTGSDDCCALTSGTDALHTAAMITGVGPGDEVLMAAHGFIATIEPFLHTGASIRYVDSKISDYCIDEDQIEKHINNKTKVIVWADINGQTPDVDKITALARKHKLWTVEDAAPSAGASYKGKKTGCLADITCFSFGPVKNFGAIGGAGAITGNKDICDEARQIKNHGRDKNHTKYDHTRAGWNRNLHTLQASFLLAKLPYLDELNDKRREHAHIYNRALADVVDTVPLEQNNQHHTYHLYSVLVDDRDRLSKELQQKGIEALAHWPRGLHDYNHTPNAEKKLINTDKITSHTLSLPCSPFLTPQERQYVIDSVIKLHE